MDKFVCNHKESYAHVHVIGLKLHSFYGKFCHSQVNIEQKRASRRQKEREKKAKAQEDSWV